MEGAIAHNLGVVRERIARATERAGREPGDIRLVGVSKTFPFTYVQAAAEAGLSDFGENRVQEALDKIERATTLVDVSWHLVGHLQSNKVRKVVGVVDWIHSLDSDTLLRRVAHAMEQQTKPTQLLVQIDLAGEATKHGASPDEARRMFDTATEHEVLQVRGLMVLPPWSDDPEQARPYFKRLRELRDRFLDDGVDPAMLTELSMGMSHDLEVAIEEGATMVRVGTDIFGRRTPPPANP